MICDSDKHAWENRGEAELMVCTVCGAGWNGQGYIAPFMVSQEDDCPGWTVAGQDFDSLITRPESPCPACPNGRTMLYDDEPTCWRCGWKRP